MEKGACPVSPSGSQPRLCSGQPGKCLAGRQKAAPPQQIQHFLLPLLPPSHGQDLPGCNSRAFFPSFLPPSRGSAEVTAGSSRVFGREQIAAVAAVMDWIFPGCKEPSPGWTRLESPKITQGESSSFWGVQGGDERDTFRGFLIIILYICLVQSLILPGLQPALLPGALLLQRHPGRAAVSTFFLVWELNF